MLSALAMLVLAQEAAETPPVMSAETRACVERYAPQVEASFSSLLDGADYIVGYVCAERVRADVVAFASNYPAPDWRLMLDAGGSDSYYVVEDSTVGQHGDPVPSEDSVETEPVGELFGFASEAYRDMWADYTPPPRIQVVQPRERPAEIMDFIGRTLLEIRINRIEMERQEDN